jgi:hypothetical protein
MVIPQNMVNYYHPPENAVTEEWCLDQYYLASILTKYNELARIAFLGEEYHLMYIQSDFWSKLPNCKIIHLNGSQNGSYRLELAKRIEADNFDFFVPNEKIWLPPWKELRKI